MNQKLNINKTDAVPLRAPLTRLDRACKYLEDKWFPCSSHILDQIEAHLTKDFNDVDHIKLLELIHKDYSLTLFCYKELCTDELTGGESTPYELEDNRSPIAELKSCPAHQLRQILKDSLPTLRLHSLESSKSYQIDRLKESLLALVATKTLCESGTIDPDLGVEVSLFRQLGYLLVAWNYPTIYQAAASSSSATHNLDDNLVKALGFSPSSLAVSLAEKWGLGKVFQQSAQGYEQEMLLAPNETNSVAQSISKLCSIGEKLARANNPELYPNALHEWEDAKVAIEQALGKEGLAMIDQAMATECEELFINSPFIFKAGTLLNLEQKLQTIESRKTAERNPYLNCCDDVLKSELLSIYDLIAAGERAEKTVGILLRKILPHAGFCSSALFTLEPGTKKLALQLKAGEIKLRQGQNLQELKHREMQDIVPLAFHSPDVLSNNGIQKGHFKPSMPACLATFFGCSQRFGVFYVELPGESYLQNPASYKDRLKALVFALNDCLELV